MNLFVRTKDDCERVMSDHRRSSADESWRTRAAILSWVLVVVSAIGAGAEASEGSKYERVTLKSSVAENTANQIELRVPEKYVLSGALEPGAVTRRKGSSYLIVYFALPGFTPYSVASSQSVSGARASEGWSSYLRAALIARAPFRGEGLGERLAALRRVPKDRWLSLDATGRLSGPEPGQLRDGEFAFTAKDGAIVYVEPRGPIALAKRTSAEMDLDIEYQIPSSQISSIGVLDDKLLGIVASEFQPRTARIEK